MADVQEFGDQIPGLEKALGETLRAQDIPKVKVFIEGYANFLRDIDYSEKPNFKTAIETLHRLADHKRLAS